MDVWETLVSNSSLVSGDVWEHINAQEGGGTLIVTSLTIDREELPLEVNMIAQDQTIEIAEPDLSVELLQSGIEVEVDFSDQEATLQETIITNDIEE
jgi:hypothetical protein